MKLELSLQDVVNRLVAAASEQECHALIIAATERLQAICELNKAAAPMRSGYLKVLDPNFGRDEMVVIPDNSAPLDFDKKQQEIAASNARILNENTENSVNDVRKWSKHDDDYLRRCYGDVAVSVGDMAGAMQRTVRAVRERANQLGLKRPAGKQMSEQAKAHKAACVAANGGVKGAWTEQDDNYLRETYGNADYTTPDIAQMLERTVMAVHRRASKLGLNRPLQREVKEHTEIQKSSATLAEELEALAENDINDDDAMQHLSDISDGNTENDDENTESSDEHAAVHAGYEADNALHKKAIELAKKYGKKAMEGTPVVVDSKTIVIKKTKKGDKK
jgi:hypothetical protein